MLYGIRIETSPKLDFGLNLFVTFWLKETNSKTDFCETLISISKSRLSRKTLVSFSISTLNFSLRTLILILNSQKFSNSHSRISTLNSRISEKSQPISYCGRKKCLQSRVLFCLISQKTVAANIDLTNQIGCQRACLFSLIIKPGGASLLFVW